MFQKCSYNTCEKWFVCSLPVYLITSRLIYQTRPNVKTEILQKKTLPSFLSAFALPFFFSKIFLSLLVTCLVTEWLKVFEILMICAILFEEQCQYQELRSYRQNKSFLNSVNILFVEFYRQKLSYDCIINTSNTIAFWYKKPKGK